VRVTFTTMYRDAAAEIGQASEQLAASERQVSSGRRIERPSDDPGGVTAAISDHAMLHVLDSYAQAADAATSRLTMVDSALSDIIDKITAAQSAAMSARGTVQTQNQREAAASALQGIADAVLGDFAAQIHGAYLFSGSVATVAPYTNVAGVVSGYQGNATTTVIDVGSSRTAPASFDASSIAQGTDPADVFTVLSNLIAAVKAGDNAGIGQGLDALGRALDRATLAQTQVGTSLHGLDDTRAELGRARLDTAGRLSKTEDVDLASAIAQMTENETAYRAALAAFSKIGNRSLMDYLT
jgi:flagellar hook-associated protein 3 FlgL